MMRIVCCALFLIFVHFVSCSLIDHVKPHVKPEDYTNTWVIEVENGHHEGKIAEFMASKGFSPLKRTQRFVGRTFMTFEHPTSRNIQIELDAAIRTKQFGILKAMRQYRQHLRTYPGVKAHLLPEEIPISLAVEPEENFNDQLFTAQWHLQNAGQSGGTPGADANVVPVWNMGITGKGVQICIVDDGLEIAHPDFEEKFNSNGSYNFLDGSFDPTTDDPELSDGHGTSCGGVAAASANNTECGVGAAYGATIAGINFLAGNASDEDAAFSLTYMYDVNDIFSNSWGPIDTGYYITSIDLLTYLAIEDATINGRNGKGSVILFAGGNGQTQYDFSSFDGFTNHRAVIAVAASDHNDVQSYYSEQGANIFLSAPSNSYEGGIVTSDNVGDLGYEEGSCTSNFGGTSSATPLVAGVIALLLEERPDLTVRDIKHILVNSVKKIDADDAGWRVNGAGLDVNDKYGFGRLDAEAAWNLAKNWTLVRPEYFTTTDIIYLDDVVIPSNGDYVTRTVQIGDDITLENVDILFAGNVEYPTGIEVSIISPSGTESKLAHARTYEIAYADIYLDNEYVTIGDRAEQSALVPVEGIEGTLVVAEPLDGCSALTNGAEVEGNIVLIRRGGCDFSVKFQNAIDIGATNIIVFNNVEGETFAMTGDLPSGVIAIMIDIESGEGLLNSTEEAGGSLSGLELQPTSKYAVIETPYNNGALFTTVQSWGESSRGTWTMKVRNTYPGSPDAANVWFAWGMDLYGVLIAAGPSRTSTQTVTPTLTPTHTPSRSHTPTQTSTRSRTRAPNTNSNNSSNSSNSSSNSSSGSNSSDGSLLVSSVMMVGSFVICSIALALF